MPQVIRVTPSATNNSSTVNSISTSGTSVPPVIGHPTHLVPVLPAASQSVVKRVIPVPSTVATINPPVVIKTETGELAKTAALLLIFVNRGPAN